MTSLEIIIISKNEEKNIANCIESVLNATRNINDVEIILVDCDSSDNTIKIAKKYPIKLIQAKLRDVDTPAAARLIGYKHSVGELILYIDGNRTLNTNNFFKLYTYLLASDQALAGVTGSIVSNINGQCPSLLSRIIRNKIKQFYDALPIGNVSVLGGPVALFKRSTLDEVGFLNPYLRAGEEAEFCYRLLAKGYKLMRFPIPIASQNIPCYSLFNFLKKYEWLYNFWVGVSLRYTYKTNKSIFNKRLYDLAPLLIYNLIILFVAFSIIMGLLDQIYFLYIAAAIYFLLFMNEYRLKKCISHAIFSVLSKHAYILSGIAIMFGFFKHIPNPDDFIEDDIIENC